MARVVENVNIQILRQCREQMGFNLGDVKNKVASIEAMETGKKKPTFKQLDTLANLYNVPRWVFVSDELPTKYNFARAIPAFRQFSERDTDVFNYPKVRSLVTRVQSFQELIIELREDAGEPLTNFNPPSLADYTEVEQFAGEIRKWLDATDYPGFPEWKKKLEQKGIFVFMTSKYPGWSKVDENLFRGLAIHKPVLPIIIINDSDSQKAQSFTLFHELGHLIRKENAFDNWSERNRMVERWCDELAAAVLMPTERFLPESSNIPDLQSIKKLAYKFQASPYACLVRLRNLKCISQNNYFDFEKKLKEEYNKQRTSLRTESSRFTRNREREVLKQYGHIYARAVFQAHHNGEINLYKLIKSFGLKQVLQVRKMENYL